MDCSSPWCSRRTGGGDFVEPIEALPWAFRYQFRIFPGLLKVDNAESKVAQQERLFLDGVVHRKRQAKALP